MTQAVQNALDAQNQYLLSYGRPHEANHSLNDINRELIRAMAKEHGGSIYLGRFQNGAELVRYRRGPILNHSCDFCVPYVDAKLQDLLGQGPKGGPWRADLFSKLLGHIERLGGCLFLWV